MLTKICKQCKKSFVTKNKNTIYCSVKCAAKGSVRQPDATKQDILYLINMVSWDEIAYIYRTSKTIVQRWAIQYGLNIKRKDNPQIVDKTHKGLYYQYISVTIEKNNECKYFAKIDSAARHIKRVENSDKSIKHIREHLIRVLKGDNKSYLGYKIESKIFPVEYRRDNKNKIDIIAKQQHQDIQLEKSKDLLRQKYYKLYAKYGNLIFTDYVYEEYEDEE